jgi:hypothetical protein
MLKNIAVAAALVIASSAAMAADAPKFYAGADVSSSKLDGVDDRENGYAAFGGMQITQNLAAEVGVRRLATIDEDGISGFYNQLSVSAIGSMPVGAGFSVFGRLGFNRVNLNANFAGEKIREHANRGVYGIGVSYNFTPAIAARVEVQKPTSDLTTFTAGVAYTF